MESKGKGKEVAGEKPSGKRKRHEDKSAAGRKRRNNAVLQFFEDVAEVDGYESTEDSDFFDDDFFDKAFDTLPTVKSEPGKTHNLPLLPKEEGMGEEEFDRLMEERYKDGSKFTYAEDSYETKRSVERNSFVPSAKDPTIWKVKCTVGRERHSAFCLMQKYVDLKSLGTKLQIISAFSVEHIKGFIYIEADKQSDVNEACKGLSSIYTTRVVTVPKNEISHLLSVRSKYNEVSAGTWARVKNGKYKGDLAEVVSVNDSRKRATVKLIPRIDLQAMAEKFGGGAAVKKTATPAPRLISSSELEEFRPLINFKHDRDMGKGFEVLDGLMLKDGYLFKKVPIDSLSSWGVTPSNEELLKFKASENDDSGDLEWLSQLYGDQKKKRIIKSDKGGGKGESSSGSSTTCSYELHDLVCIGRKGFGIFIGMEKDDNYKILKEGPEGPVVVTVQQNELKNGPLSKKFTAFDKSMKTISINDTIRVLDGPSKGRQGIVKQIYRGTVFLHDENDAENGGYLCSKSTMCEKIKLSSDAFIGKGGESGSQRIEDFPSSPKSPLSPKRPWQSNRDFNQGDKDGMFSVGQTLRIRLGPLKGYLCRVLAIRRTDVTVKLDSQHKIFTVKSEHLAEVRGKGSRMSESGDGNSLKPFDLLGTEGCSSGWMDGAGKSADGEGWSAGGLSTGRNSWSSFPASGLSLQPESSTANLGSVDNDPKEEDAAWEKKVTPSQTSSWGTAKTDEKAVDNNKQVGSWGSKDGSSGSKEAWNSSTTAPESPTGAWGNAGGPGAENNDETSVWKKDKVVSGSQTGNSGGWNVGGSSNQDQTDSWKKPKSPAADGGSSWGKQDGGSSWGKQDGGSSWSKQDGGSSWSKQDGGSLWSKQDDGTDGGHGSGRGRGRGGSQGGQDQFGRGRSFGWDQSFGNPSGWNSEPAGGDKWNSKPSGSHESNWNSDREGGRSSRGQNEGGTWNASKPSDGTLSSAWNKGVAESGKSTGSSSWNSGKALTGDQDGGWKSRTSDEGGNQSDWNKSSEWNKKSAENEKENEHKSRGDGWNSGKSSDGGSTAGWGQSTGLKSDVAGRGQDSNWGKKSSWNAGSSDAAGGNQDSNWGKKSNWNSGSSDGAGGNQDSNWGKNSNWNSGVSDSSGNQTSDWGKKGSWNSGFGDAGGDQENSWSRKSTWNSGNTYNGSQSTAGGSENEADTLGNGESGGNWRGGFGGRGGFRGRGRSDRGGFGDEGGREGRGFRGRGGFGGRGRSDRGGFGDSGGTDGGGYRGRGRGRRDDWNNRNESGEANSFGYNEGGNNNEGWKSGSGGASNQAGGSSWNQPLNSKDAGAWSKGTDSPNGDSSTGGQWSSWNKSSVGKEVTGSQNQDGGWNKGQGSSALAGDSNNKCSVWNQETVSGKGSTNAVEAKSWNQSDGGLQNQGSGWNQSESGQSSGWNQPKDAKEGTTGSVEPTDSWGKAAAASSTWGKGNDGGGKGGW